MNESTNLIVVKQLPIIEERLKSKKDAIRDRVTSAMSLVATEDNLQTLKKTRAELNKEFEALEKQRKIVKATIMAPYDAFEATYKDCATDVYKPADADLKKKIDEVEDGLKDAKRAEVKAYFDEYAQSKGIDFVSFERSGIKVIISSSLKGLKTEAKQMLDKVGDDLALIETQEHKDEILVDYKATLNASAAIKNILDRHARIAAEAARRAEVEKAKANEAAAVKKVEAFSTPEVVVPQSETPPTTSSEPKYTMAFKVKGTMAQLKGLKQYIVDSGIQAENVEA